MRNVILFLAGAAALNGCSPGTPRPGSAPPLAAAEAFVDAFYSFDAERLKEALSAAPESQPRIVYYQGWAQGGNYVVARRTPCRAESPELVVCSITVKDDLIQALGTGFDVTDTFHLGISGGRIVSVRTTSNDPPEFDQAMEWVERERSGLVEVPCRDAFEGGPTPQACVRAMVQGFREFTALGRPAAVDTPSSALPLRDANALVVVNAWEGYSPVSPTQATYRLERSADGSFTGTVQISVGAGWVRRDTSFAIHLPRAAADSLLRVLSEAPLREERYRPTFTHTDDYPSISVDVTVGDSVIRFHTRSQGTAHVPWQVRAGGRRYVSGSEAIWSALSAVLGRIGNREQRALIEAVQRDPEAQCRHNRYQLPSAQRPRYAGGEAWFTRDSSITVQGRAYRKHALPRILGLNEISPYATYRGVTVFQEAGLEGTPETLYVPVHASCELQPYSSQPRP